MPQRQMPHSITGRFWKIPTEHTLQNSIWHAGAENHCLPESTGQMNLPPPTCFYGHTYYSIFSCDWLLVLSHHRLPKALITIVPQLDLAQDLVKVDTEKMMIWWKEGHIERWGILFFERTKMKKKEPRNLEPRKFKCEFYHAPDSHENSIEALNLESQFPLFKIRSLKAPTWIPGYCANWTREHMWTHFHRKQPSD